MAIKAITSLTEQECFEKMCAGKQGYPSESAARAALRMMRDSHIELRRPSSLGVYPCRFCKEWHIGH